MTKRVSNLPELLRCEVAEPRFEPVSGVPRGHPVCRFTRRTCRAWSCAPGFDYHSERLREGERAHGAKARATRCRLPRTFSQGCQSGCASFLQQQDVTAPVCCYIRRKLARENPGPRV